MAPTLNRDNSGSTREPSGLRRQKPSNGKGGSEAVKLVSGSPHLSEPGRKTSNLHHKGVDGTYYRSWARSRKQ